MKEERILRLKNQKIKQGNFLGNDTLLSSRGEINESLLKHSDSGSLLPKPYTSPIPVTSKF